MTTPAEAEVVERAVRSEQRNQRYNFAMLAMVGLTCVILAVGGLVLYVKVDSKVSDIRATQMVNTALSNRRANCQDEAFNAVLKDARLAFTGDKNAADYAKAPQSC